MNVGIYVYDDAEVLDFSGPFEVFSTSIRVSKNPELFNVFLIGESGDTVIARGNYRINPHYSFRNHPPIDILIVVGGVHTGELEKKTVLGWIKEQSNLAEYTASICTGAFLLAEAQVLSNQTVTTHWEDIADLKARYPHLNVVENQRWVDQGNLITSGGISAGIDMSLYLLSKITSLELAKNTAIQMEYEWNSGSN